MSRIDGWWPKPRWWIVNAALSEIVYLLSLALRTFIDEGSDPPLAFLGGLVLNLLLWQGAVLVSSAAYTTCVAMAVRSGTSARRRLAPVVLSPVMVLPLLVIYVVDEWPLPGLLALSIVLLALIASFASARVVSHDWLSSTHLRGDG